MKAALVLATAHDYQTRFCRATADPARALLAHRGFAVLPHLDHLATAAHVRTELPSRRSEHGWRFRKAYCCAHGSDRGLHDGLGGLALDLHACGEFEEAIVILNACMGSGLFPDRAVALGRDAPSSPGPVRAVIYYRDRLRIPLPELFARCSPDAEDLFRSLLVYPVFLLLQGLTVEVTVTTLRRRWFFLAQDGRQHRFFQAVCRWNGEHLDFSGAKTACLP